MMVMVTIMIIVLVVVIIFMIMIMILWAKVICSKGRNSTAKLECLVKKSLYLTGFVSWSLIIRKWFRTCECSLSLSLSLPLSLSSLSLPSLLPSLFPFPSLFPSLLSTSLSPFYHPERVCTTAFTESVVSVRTTTGPPPRDAIPSSWWRMQVIKMASWARVTSRNNLPLHNSHGKNSDYRPCILDTFHFKSTQKRMIECRVYSSQVCKICCLCMPLSAWSLR